MEGSNGFVEPNHGVIGLLREKQIADEVAKVDTKSVTPESYE